MKLALPTSHFHGEGPWEIRRDLQWDQSNKHVSHFLGLMKHMGSAASDQNAYLEKKQRLNFEQGKTKKRAT